MEPYLSHRNLYKKDLNRYKRATEDTISCVRFADHHNGKSRFITKKQATVGTIIGRKH
jgi:hypothetical protein